MNEIDFPTAELKIRTLVNNASAAEADARAGADDYRRALHAMTAQNAEKGKAKDSVIRELEAQRRSNPGATAVLGAAIDRLKMRGGVGDMVRFKVPVGNGTKWWDQIGTVINASDPAECGGLVVVEISFGSKGTAKNVPVSELELVQSYV